MSISARDFVWSIWIRTFIALLGRRVQFLHQERLRFNIIPKSPWLMTVVRDSFIRVACKFPLRVRSVDFLIIRSSLFSLASIQSCMLVLTVGYSLKDQKLRAVPFDKGCGFYVMKQTTYLDELNEIVSASQFAARNGGNDDLTIKTEKLTNSSLHQKMKQKMTNKKIYHRLSTTGWQQASLTKVHKNGTPLRTVLSTSGSS